MSALADSEERLRLEEQNLLGQLGNGQFDSSGGVAKAQQVVGIDSARQISAGWNHTCALLDNGTVRCWGSGSFGRLGYGNTTTIGDNETPGSVGPVDLGAGLLFGWQRWASGSWTAPARWSGPGGPPRSWAT